MNASAIDQIEQAIYLLRRQSAENWLRYALAATPLTVALFWMMFDLSGPLGRQHALRDSFLCSIAFLWSVFWKARFSGTLDAVMNGEDTPERSSWQSCALTQSVVHSLKLFLLPFAIVSVAPLPWMTALFRAAHTEADRPWAALTPVLRNAFQQASNQSRANWAGAAIYVIAGIVLFANIYIVLAVLPGLFKSFTGAETEWTRNSYGYSRHLFPVSFVLTWLMLDPLMQAFSVVRRFYFYARSDARDLLRVVRRISTAALLLIALTSFSKAEVTPQQIQRGIDASVRRSDYDWVRAPKEKAADGLGARIAKDISDAIDSVGKAIDRFFHWLNKLFTPGDSQTAGAGRKNQTSAPRLQILIWCLAGGIAVLVVFIFFRTRRPSHIALHAGSAAPAVDLTAEDVVATDRPVNEWLSLAADYEQRGELRLAVRALFLACLAHLAERQLIAVAKAKSNSMYAAELRRRSRNAELACAFAEIVRIYERSWYGDHEVTPSIRAGFDQSWHSVHAHA